MSSERPSLWYLVFSIVHTFVKWLDARFSSRRKRVQKADDLFQEGMKDKDEAKVTGALDKLKRIEKP